MSDTLPDCPPTPTSTIPATLSIPAQFLRGVKSTFRVNAVYYPNWRVYRGETPEKLDYGLISHVFYAFAYVESDGRVYLSDEFADLNISCDGVNGCINSLRQIRERHTHLKLLLSIGGGVASGNFATAASTINSRHKFASTVTGLIETYGFDGIDIDWEHPSNDQQGRDFIDLLATIRLYLPVGEFLLTTALPSAPWALRNINIAQANQYLDFINLMAYDFTNAARAGYHAQLYSRSANEDSGSKGVDFLLSQDFPGRKILLGIPCYGRSFLGASAAGDIAFGNGGQEGTFEYQELPRPMAQERVNTLFVSAICVGGDGGFISYDNPETVKMKAEFSKIKGLAGLFYWTGTADKSGPYSLVNAGFKALHNS